MLKHVLCCAIGLLAGVAVNAGAEEEKVLNVYNWSDYIAEDTIRKFEERTGIKVRYDVFDSNEVLEAKLLAGQTGYDVVVPSGGFVERQIKAGVFQKLDKSKLKNSANLDAEIMKQIGAYDPGNQYVTPYLWGTTGIGYNIKKIRERMPEAPIDSWDMIFKPEIIAKFADCGVTLLDAPAEVAPTALSYLGLNPGSQDPKDLEKVEALLAKIRPHIKYFHSSKYIDDLANGETCLVLGWSGDILQARDRAAEAGQGVEVGYSIPREGALIWFDLTAIPADAPHPGNAHLFLDYLMEAEVMAGISNYVNYANANTASTSMVSEEVKGDPSIYPTEEVKAKLFPSTPNTAQFDRLLTRTWTRVKTGK